MSLIIAATDYTAVAQNAVKYACQLAADQNAQVLILHSYSIPVMFSDVAVPATLVNDEQDDAEKQMEELVTDMQRAYPALDVKGKVVYGDTIDILDEQVRSTSPMLIVVGNSITGNDDWLDSTLMEEFKKLKYPVLAVPPGMEYKPVHKICLAFDNKHTGNDIALQQLTTLTTAMNAELHVVHTQAEAQGAGTAIDEGAKMKLAAVQPQYHMIYEAHDTDSAVHSFAKDNAVDWLVLIPRKHSFFEGLFRKSHTKAIAQNTNIPIVALHERD